MPAIKKALEKEVDEAVFGKVLAVCGGDTELANRIRPFAHLLRADAWGDFIVYKANAFAVTLGADRRETGTHYTPKSLTESIVETTLEPVVYIGPAEGKPREEWKLKSSAELLELKICDPAMGSGAFLVQVCRWLGERVVEAWGNEEAQGKAITVDGDVKDSLGGLEPISTSLDDRLIIAKRLIAEKCLYGVDLNPLAVELAKLSIWLVTLAKGRPFGFLDHNLRDGDSLLGIHRLDQLTEFTMNPTGTGNKPLFAQNIETAVDEVIEIRKSLRQTPIRDIRDVEVMAKLDKQARQKLESIELVADAMVGETLASGGNVNVLKEALASLSAYVGDFLAGNNEIERNIRSKDRRNLSSELPVGKASRKPFNWHLEFPEVFEKGGFDGIVGNPPFMGGQKITGNLGTAYRNHLVDFIACGQKGSADLCVYFFLRNALLLRKLGHMGLLSTNTVAQGDSREVGLQQLEDMKYSIPSAIQSQKWPGKANLEVAIVWLRHGVWSGQYVLEGKGVDGITSYLTAPGEVTGNPYRLKANENKSFQGSIVLGMGFVLEPEDAQTLIKRDSKNKDVLFPYLNGQDLNSRSDQSPSRWVINFFDWPLERIKLAESWSEANNKKRKKWLQDGIVPLDYPDPVASDYPDCLTIIESRVKPERTRKKEDGSFILRKPLPQKWWIYGEKRPKLYSSIDNLDRVFAAVLHTKYWSIGVIENGLVFSHALVVFSLRDWADFAFLSSNIHEVWARNYSGSLETRLRYSPTDCFETFPLPKSSTKIKIIGEDLYRHRRKILKLKQEGLTKTYNRLHNPEQFSEDIQEIRDLHLHLDNAVATAYGWGDLHLGHGFHETKQGLRFTISEEARREVLQRLLKLNHERYAEEVAQGLHDKKTKKKTAKKKAKKQQEKTLF